MKSEIVVTSTYKLELNQDEASWLATLLTSPIADSFIQSEKGRKSS